MTKLSKHFDTNVDLMLSCPCCGRADFDEEYIERMERLRVITNAPMVVVSGFRCEDYNSSPKVRGKPGSEHTLGLAMDIKVWDSGHRFDLQYYGPKCGLTRFGIENTTMHIGGGNADTGHPERKTWHYYAKYRRK
jgi:hypothetical protein